ncbi:condensation domain-containing protein, partial [Mucilaginibacter sp. SG538B]|uniref:condensation domain-containing protein n=1 Tax=Mucilaginibacter sp. SG538B TaxID=2587021 RepID=UPI0021025FC9
DDQVKIRGYRIELGEIEAAVLAFEGIREALVIAREDASGDKQLCCYYLTHEQNDIDRANLRAFLLSRLPGYMVPNAYLMLGAFPLTANGKVDKKALPLPDTGAAREHTPPRNSTEAQLAGIWKKVLDIHTVGVHDNFFELGGQSLKITRLASQIHHVFDVMVPLRELFSAPSLEDQAKYIDQARRSAFSAIPVAPPSDSYILSSSQRRMWILSQFEEGNIAYNMPGAYLFEGQLDYTALNAAFEQLLQRHEILRTVFRENADGEIRQYIIPLADLNFKIDYQDLRPSTGLIELDSIIKESFLLAFDLAEGPLLRVAIYQLADDRWLFTYVMHHIISDGWSM